ncbi:MAG: hypothetical protein OEY07_18000 [Gammaproteobacteria bacterium]|nr:hypothetical protein [Gammaproteobacteria bacterium]
MFKTHCDSAVISRYRIWLWLPAIWFGLLIKTAHADMMIEAGVHFGGDEVIESPYSDGQTGSIKAGENYTFAFGPMFKLIGNWQLQTTIGMKTGADYALDGLDEVEVSLVRFPLNALLFYEIGSFRFGYGTTWHVAPKLKGSGVASNVSQEFDDAVGEVVEIDFRQTERFLWAIRYTRIEYENSLNGQRYDGTSIGILIVAQM